MLSLTGSLLADPSKPQALPEGAAASLRVPSLSPDLPEPPKKVARTQPKKQQQPRAAAIAAESAEPAIDESKLTPRELKKLRKEQEKAKRDARKARKGEDEQESPSLKRKAEEDEEAEGARKKRKE